MPGSPANPLNFTLCLHYYPRRAAFCNAPSAYLIDSLVGACAEHLGSRLAWVLDDEAAVRRGARVDRRVNS